MPEHSSLHRKRPAKPTSYHSAAAHSTRAAGQQQAVLRLQRQVGNQAVHGLLLQREGEAMLTPRAAVEAALQHGYGGPVQVEGRVGYALDVSRAVSDVGLLSRLLPGPSKIQFAPTLNVPTLV